MGLRVSGLFVIFAVSLVGALIPLHSIKGLDDRAAAEFAKSPFYLVMRMFGAGIMLGVAFIHLLADANESLTTVYPGYSALSMVLATAGCILVLSTEHAALYFMDRVSAHRAFNGPNTERECELHTTAGERNAAPTLRQGEMYHGGADCTCMPLVGGECSSSAPPGDGNTSHDHIHDHDHGHHDAEQGHSHEHRVEHFIHGQQLQILGHSLACSPGQAHADETCGHGHAGHAHALVADGEPEDEMRLTVKAFVMEFAIATHSIIIGVAFGAMGEDSLPSLRALYAALSFHQFFEGIALGAAIASASRALGGWKVACFVAIFSVTTPLGIMIGILALPSDSTPTDNQEYAQGVLNSIAAGNLIYIALVEMIAEDMSASFLSKRFSLKALMIGALVLGDFCMAILAIWA